MLLLIGLSASTEVTFLSASVFGNSVVLCRLVNDDVDDGY